MPVGNGTDESSGNLRWVNRIRFRHRRFVLISIRTGSVPSTRTVVVSGVESARAYLSGIRFFTGLSSPSTNRLPGGLTYHVSVTRYSPGVAPSPERIVVNW